MAKVKSYRSLITAQFGIRRVTIEATPCDPAEIFPTARRKLKNTGYPQAVWRRTRMISREKSDLDPPRDLGRTRLNSVRSLLRNLLRGTPSG